MKLDRTYSDILVLKQVTRSWNNSYATGTVAGHHRVIGPFRAVTSRGDFLSRNNYSSDNNNVPFSSANGKHVADSSDYTYYKKQRSMNLSRNNK